MEETCAGNSHRNVKSLVRLNEINRKLRLRPPLIPVDVGGGLPNTASSVRILPAVLDPSFDFRPRRFFAKPPSALTWKFCNSSNRAMASAYPFFFEFQVPDRFVQIHLGLYEDGHIPISRILVVHKRNNVSSSHFPYRLVYETV
jgi:hypothetical protein